MSLYTTGVDNWWPASFLMWPTYISKLHHTILPFSCFCSAMFSTKKRKIDDENMKIKIITPHERGALAR